MASVFQLCILTLIIASLIPLQLSRAQGPTVGPPVSSSKNQTIIEQILASKTEVRSLNDLMSMVASMTGASSNQISREYEHSSRFGGKTQVKFDWKIDLDKAGLVRLNWRVDYHWNKILFSLEFFKSSTKSHHDTRTLETTRFRPGTDIFAVGFSQDGQLGSSDFCLLWYDLSHRLHLQDARTDANNRLELIDASESVCRRLGSGGMKTRHRASVIDSGSSINEANEASNGAHGANDSSDADADDAADDDHGESDHPSPRVDHLEVDEGSRPRGELIERVAFKRPLDVCHPAGGRNYYRIDNGTTNLIWFRLAGPVLSIDGLNLTEFMASDRESGGRSHHGQRHGASGPNFEFGLTRVQLIATKPSGASQQRQSTATTAAKYHDVRMDRYQIPARETTYWCKLFKLPAKFERRKFHITSYEALVQEGNEHVVHHMELFNCAHLSAQQASELEQLYELGGGWSGECSASSRPKATDPCRRVLLAWAMGAKPLVYPEEVGQSIGGGPGFSPYVVLEVHYNNIGSLANQVDSSGLRFHYSSALRPYDAGVLEVGLEYTDKNSIPPGMLVPLAGHCVSECTRVAMGQLDGRDHSAAGPQTTTHERANHHSNTNRARNNGIQNNGIQNNNNNNNNADQNNNNGGQPAGPAEGIYIFAAQMHTHLTGVASWTEHIRGGRHLAELQRDDHYSPHFQEIRLLPRPVHVRPGDALVHYCLYDTRRRVNVTLGGFATSDEMCVTYLHYYPRLDLEVCKSSVETRALEAYFAYLAAEERQRTSKKLVELQAAGGGGGANMLAAQNATKTTTTTTTASQVKQFASVSENYRSIEWSPRRSGELIQFYAEAPLSVQCNRSNGQRWPGHWEGLEPTRLWQRPPQDNGPEGRDQEEHEEEEEEEDGDRRLQSIDGANQFDAPGASCPHQQQHVSGPLAAGWLASRPTGASQPVGYRGRGHGRRHLRCLGPAARASAF